MLLLGESLPLVLFIMDVVVVVVVVVVGADGLSISSLFFNIINKIRKCCVGH